MSLLVLCLALHITYAASGRTVRAKSLAPKATSDEQKAADAKKAEPKSAKQSNFGVASVKRPASKSKKTKPNKNKNPVGPPRTAAPPGPTVDKRVDFVRPVGQNLAENGGSSSGGWPNEIPSKGKRRKGNRKGWAALIKCECTPAHTQTHTYVVINWLLIVMDSERTFDCPSRLQPHKFLICKLFRRTSIIRFIFRERWKRSWIVLKWDQIKSKT